MNKDIYNFGKCRECDKNTVLKNGYCVECEEHDIPDFIKDLFKQKDNDES